MANKVKFGLKNVFYSVLTQTTPGATPTYATPVAWPGAVSLTMDPVGDATPFYADNTVYWMSNSNNGYSGTFESALIPETFRTAVLGEQTDSVSGMLYEDATISTKPFALLFQIEGDDKASKHVIYNITANRPSIGSQTTEDTITPVTDTIELTAVPLVVGSNGFVKGRIEDGATGYAGFFSAVVVPTV